MGREVCWIEQIPDDATTLGTCCVCDRTDRVTVALFLDGLSPTKGAGWGCFVCGLPADGAIAVACEACAIQVEAGVVKPRYVCAGVVSAPGRVPFAHMRGTQAHDLGKHVDEDGGW